MLDSQGIRRSRRRLFSAFAAVLTVVGALCLAVRESDAEIIDRVLAVVDGQIITLSDVRGVLRFNLVRADVSEDPIAAAMQRLIERRLMLNEVERYSPAEPPQAVVDTRVAAIQARFKDALAFEIALNQTALSREELRRYVRDTLRIETYLQQRFSTAADASEEPIIRDWLDGLRRRGNVVIVYLPGGR